MGRISGHSVNQGPVERRGPDTGDTQKILRRPRIVENPPRRCQSLPVQRFLDWAGTILYGFVFGAILLFYDVALRLASLLGIKAVERVAVSLQTTLVASYRVLGASLTASISPKVREGESYIIVSNHQSMFDIPLFAWAFPRNNGKYITKKQLGQWIPAVSTNLKLGNHPLIDRHDTDSALHLIADLGERVARGEVSAVIFPEGTRARAGQMKRFRPAGLKMLLEHAPDAKIVPCCLDNLWKLMRHGFRPIPFGVKLRFWVGDPIERAPGEDIEALSAQIEGQIRAHLDRWRAEPDA